MTVCDMTKSFTKNSDWIFLSFLSLAGIGLVFLATSKYGAGVAGDSIHYISVAGNLLNGKGFVDYTGGPLIWFPPLMPVLMAGLAWLFRADVFVVGWVLNALLWGLNIFLSGYFLRRIFLDRPVYFYLSTLIVFLSPSALTMHASVLSDPLFLTFALFFFITGEMYIERPNWRPFAALLVLAILAPLQRYSGFAQIVTGSLIVVYAHGRKILKGVPLAALFGVISALPIAMWVYLHNYLGYGTYWGTNNTAGADTTINILQSLRKIMYWFIPYRPLTKDGLVEPVVILGLIIVILLVINKLHNWWDWAKEFLRPAFVSALVLTFVYFTSSILNIQTGDHKSLFSDRYFVIILVPILALIFTTFDRLVLPHIHFRMDVLQAGMVILFLLWSAYPGYKIYKYLRESLTNGESGYNEYNIRVFHESETLAKVKALLEKEPDARLYSNIAPAVWFITRHEMTLPPAQDVKRTRDEIKAAFAGWPNDKPGYYIWFEPDPFELFMPLNDLYLVADMEVVEKAADGMIVRVWARKGQQ
jgi:hypothetical protein